MGTSSPGTGAASTSGASTTGTSSASTSGESTTGTGDASTTGTSSATATGTTTAGTTETSGGVEGCTAEAVELIALVNAYRVEQGLAAIPASPSLCAVGQAHVVDLHEQQPHEKANCNLHSWSDAGSWSGCCYTSDHAKAECMWNKPRELTAYPGDGYENAATGSGPLTPAAALALWKGSKAHNDVILNRGIWAERPWRALGAGVHEGYAVLWFGRDDDPAAR
jgi:uncharacterized protein YkwD